MKNIACLQLPQVDKYGNESTFLYPLNSLEAYESMAREGYVPMPTIDMLASNEYFQGALGLHKMNAQIASTLALNPISSKPLSEYAGMNSFIRTVGMKIFNKFQNTSKDELAKIMNTVSVEMKPELRKLVNQTKQAAREAGQEGINKLTEEANRYMNGREVNFGNIHPSFIKLAEEFANNPAVQSMIKSHALSEIDELCECETGTVGDLGILGNLPKWVYWVGGALGIGIIGWFLLKKFGGSGGVSDALKSLRQKAFNGYADNTKQLGRSEKRIRNLLGGKNNFAQASDPVSSVIKTNEFGDYALDIGDLAEGLSRIPTSFHMKSIGNEFLEPDYLDETTLKTLELGAFQMLGYTNKYQSLQGFLGKVKEKDGFFGDLFYTRGVNNKLAQYFGGYEEYGKVLLSESKTNATIQLGGFFSRMFKKVKRASKGFRKLIGKAVKATVPGAALIAKGIKSVTGRNLKKRSKATLKRAKRLDAMRSRINKLNKSRNIVASEYKKNKQKEDRTTGRIQKAAFRQQANIMRQKVGQVDTTITKLQNELASEKLKYKNDVDGLKNTIKEAKKDYSRVKDLEKTKVSTAEEIRSHPDVTKAPNLIYLTPREYAEHVNSMQKAKALASKMSARVSSLMEDKRKCNKSMSKKSLKIYQLKNKLSNITRKLAQALMQGKVDEKSKQERIELLRKIKDHRDAFNDQLNLIKNYSDESLKQAGKQINETGINMMFNFLDKLTRAMQNVKNVSQVSEFLKFFPELMQTFRYTVNTVMPKAPTVENVIHVPEPVTVIEPTDQHFHISPKFRINPATPNVQNKVVLDTEVHPQNINVPVNVATQGLKIVPVQVQVESGQAKPAAQQAWFKKPEQVAV